MSGAQEYTNIPVPILAIYGLPHDPGPASTAAMPKHSAESRRR
jgi:hypothetical protein